LSGRIGGEEEQWFIGGFVAVLGFQGKKKGDHIRMSGEVGKLILEARGGDGGCLEKIRVYLYSESADTPAAGKFGGRTLPLLVTYVTQMR